MAAEAFGLLRSVPADAAISQYSRARPFGVERRRRAARRPRRHPRARAERRASHRGATERSARWVGPQFTLTLALAMYLVRRER